MWRVALIAFFVFACAKPEVNVDRAAWQRMSQDEKTLYVRSLIGGEKVKERKEGKIRPNTKEPEEYVKEIDAAYARGDQRRPQQIFDSAPEGDNSR